MRLGEFLIRFRILYRGHVLRGCFPIERDHLSMAAATWRVACATSFQFESWPGVICKAV